MQIKKITVGEEIWTLVRVDGFVGTRRRVRRIDEDTIAEVTAMTCVSRGEDYITADHGGSVANKYGYPAQTECAITVALRAERMVLQWCDRAPANKVTYSGVARACLGSMCPHASDIWDGRTNEETTQAGRAALFAFARQQIFDLRIAAELAVSQGATS